MAKKKTDENSEPTPIDISKEITSTYGKDIIIDASAILDEPSVIIPVSPAIDIGLNGGIPEGSWVTFTGRAKCGKTTACLHVAAKCQKPEYGSRQIYYLNIEGRLKKMNLQGVKGLDLAKMHVISSQQGNILSAESFLAIAEKIATTVPGSVIIIDSYSALCTENEITKGMDEQQRTDGQKLLAKFCRRMANIVPVNKNIIMGITHLMGNPSGYGAAEKEKGGFAIAYQADIKLRATGLEKLTNKSGKQYGQSVEWLVEVSALGPPGAKVNSIIRYGQGIDEISEILELAVELGVIEAKGAWYNFNNAMVTLDKAEQEMKFQGKENLYHFLDGSPKVVAKLTESIRKLLYG